MQPFRFRYQALLRKAEAEETARQQALAEQLKMRLILENQLRQMQTRLTEARHELSGKLVGRVDLSAVTQVARHATDTELRGRQMVQSLAVVGRKIDHARNELAKAMRQRKLFERLRERDREAYDRAARRKEGIVLDDLASQAFVRSMSTTMKGGRV